MEGLRGVETLTVNEVVILFTKIFFGILYVNQRSLLGIVRGVRTCPCCSGTEMPASSVIILWQRTSGFRCDVQQTCHFLSSDLVFGFKLFLAEDGRNY